MTLCWRDCFSFDRTRHRWSVCVRDLHPLIRKVEKRERNWKTPQNLRTYISSFLSFHWLTQSSVMLVKQVLTFFSYVAEKKIQFNAYFFCFTVERARSKKLIDYVCFSFFFCRGFGKQGFQCQGELETVSDPAVRPWLVRLSILFQYAASWFTSDATNLWRLSVLESTMEQTQTWV